MGESSGAPVAADPRDKSPGGDRSSVGGDGSEDCSPAFVDVEDPGPDSTGPGHPDPKADPAADPV